MKRSKKSYRNAARKAAITKKANAKAKTKSTARRSAAAKKSWKQRRAKARAEYLPDKASIKKILDDYERETEDWDIDYGEYENAWEIDEPVDEVGGEAYP